MAAILTVVGALLGAATVYLRLAIRSQTIDATDKVKEHIEKVFVRRELMEIHLDGLKRRISQLEVRRGWRGRADEKDESDHGVSER